MWRDFRRIVKRVGLPAALTVQDVPKMVDSGMADDGLDGEARRQITGHKT